MEQVTSQIKKATRKQYNLTKKEMTIGPEYDVSIYIENVVQHRIDPISVTVIDELLLFIQPLGPRLWTGP